MRMMEEEWSCKAPHVVMVPFLAQGHIIPFLELSKLLCEAGVVISFITTPRNGDRIRGQVESCGLPIRLVTLGMPAIEGLPKGVENSENIPKEQVDLLMISWHRLSDSFEQWLTKAVYIQEEEEEAEAEATPQAQTQTPPVCVITGMFGDWVHASAAKFGLPTLVFYTTGAFGTALLHAIVNHDPQNGKGEDEAFRIPGLSFEAEMRKSDLAVHMRVQQENPKHDSIRALINKSTEGHMFIFNSFEELEPEAVQHLRNITQRPVLCVGPLLPQAMFNVNEQEEEEEQQQQQRLRLLSRGRRGRASDISEEECVAWLNGRAKRSVLFVCLGSQFLMTAEQSRAVAEALQLSGQAFVWAIRCQDCGKALPDGFEESTRDRGLLIWGWAPQLMILAHSAIAAFLTHSGWNSTLECMSLGVPMLTWPMFADQPFNSKLLVERLRVAVQVCVDIAGVPDPHLLSNAVQLMLLTDEGAAMRRRAQDVARRARLAVQHQRGSSRLNVALLAHRLRHLLHLPLPLPLPLPLLPASHDSSSSNSIHDVAQTLLYTRCQLLARAI